MVAPLLGGFEITQLRWVGPRDLQCVFTTTYGSTYHYQLYAGRRRIGGTRRVTDTTIYATLQPSASPAPITLLAVLPAQRATDYGSLLPLRPYNVVRWPVTAAAWPADSREIQIAAGTEPGGAVDTANIVARVLYDKDREYTLETKPFERSGTWNIEAAGVDDRETAGNRGTALVEAIALTVYPPDVTMSGGDRLTVSISGQSATVALAGGYP